MLQDDDFQNNDVQAKFIQSLFLLPTISDDKEYNEVIQKILKYIKTLRRTGIINELIDYGNNRNVPLEWIRLCDSQGGKRLNIKAFLMLEKFAIQEIIYEQDDLLNSLFMCLDKKLSELEETCEEFMSKLKIMENAIFSSQPIELLKLFQEKLKYSFSEERLASDKLYEGYENFLRIYSTVNQDEFYSEMEELNSSIIIKMNENKIRRGVMIKNYSSWFDSITETMMRELHPKIKNATSHSLINVITEMQQKRRNSM